MGFNTSNPYNSRLRITSSVKVLTSSTTLFMLVAPLGGVVADGSPATFVAISSVLGPPSLAEFAVAAFKLVAPPISEVVAGSAAVFAAISSLSDPPILLLAGSADTPT